jgi:tRNA G18 (ribose-2'-O)-methylase SpoU
MPESVTDPHDPRLDEYRGLRDGSGQRQRDDGFLIAEGANVVRRLFRSGLGVRSVVITKPRLGALADLVFAAESIGADVLVVAPDALATVTGFDVHRGVLAAADRPTDPGLDAVVDEVVRTRGTVAVLQGLNDHENLGAIARAARGLGVGALVLDPTCADPWYRRTVRVSMGEILDLPITRVADIADAIDMLRATGVIVAALTPHRETAAGLSTNLLGWQRPDAPVAVVLGAEGPGLPDATFAASDVRLRIPLDPDVDSLNVGHAAAIAFAVIATAD